MFSSVIAFAQCSAVSREVISKAILRTLLAFIFLIPAMATAASVRGSLSTPNAGVGEAVEYELIIEGGNPSDAPTPPTVDGIEWRGTSQSSSTLITNGSVKHTTSYTFTFVPRKEGTFIIPPIAVEVDGKKQSTDALTLKVSPAEKTAGEGDFAFGEIRVGRKTVYVGEDVPLDFRYFLDNSANWEGRQAPTLEGDGFTMRRVVLTGKSVESLAGKQYLRVVLRTVATPTKAGKFSLGPAEMRFVYSKQKNRLYLPFGNNFGPMQELVVSAPAVELEVKPLPVNGRPKDFDGAVGKFQLTATGRPDKVKAGDPVTMTVTITGQGNFDRISAPALDEPAGWRTYNATDKFDARDALGLTGTKTFEIAVVPEEKKDATPVFAFSYFDPDEAKYVTLKSDPSPLVVEGTFTPPPSPAQPADGSAPKPAAPEDIIGILPALGMWGAPVAMSPLMWFGVMFAPLPVFALLFAWRAKKCDPRAAATAALRREKAALLAKVRATQDRAELFDAAARVLQIEVALASNQPLAGVDEAAVLARHNTPGVREIFAARAELVYAGGRGGDALKSIERDKVLETLAECGRAAR